MPDWFISAAGFVFMLAAPVLAWWGSNRYFTGRFDEQQRNTQEWRMNVEQRLRNIDTTLTANSYAVLAVKMEHVEQDLAGMHRWKHEVIDPYVPGAINALKERLDKIEHRVWHGSER